ncbi:MAG: hypothetical protein ABSG86_27610 [Thermoguttaceae bacterium]
MSKIQHPLDLVLSRLTEHAKSRGLPPPAMNGDGQGSACCPAHDDRRQSLSVAVGDGGGVLLKCHAGCPTESVVEAMGLKMRALFPSHVGRNGNPATATYYYLDEDGRPLFQVLRYTPKSFSQRRPDGKGGWIASVRGVRRILYRLPELLAAPASKVVYIVEGEKDVDRLRSLGLVATCNPMGAGKWRPEFAECLAGRRVVVIPDNDEAGRAHADQVARSLAGAARSVKLLDLPDLPEHGDVSDWLDAGGTKGKLLAMAKKTPAWAPAGRAEDKATESKTAGAEVKRGKGAGRLKTLSLSQCRKVFAKWLLLPDSTVVDIVLGCAVGNELQGDPLWLLLVGPPGDGKTELLRSLFAHEAVCSLSSFSPQALISGLKPEKGEADPSLLPDLNGRLVIVKDFGMVLQMRRESRHEVFSLLRDVYDGESSKGFGSGGEKIKRFQAKFNLLVGTTDAVELYGDLNQQLGERFLRYHLPIGDAKAKIKRALDNEGSKDRMRRELSDAAVGFLHGATRRRPSVPARVKASLVNLAHLLAKARTSVCRDRNSKEIVTDPVPETGTRIANQLLRLGLSVAMGRGEKRLTPAEFKIMVKAAFDSMPTRRRALLSYLAQQAGFLTTDATTAGLRWPKGTCRLVLEDLHILGLVEQQTEKIGRTSVAKWRLAGDVRRVFRMVGEQ